MISMYSIFNTKFALLTVKRQDYANTYHDLIQRILPDSFLYLSTCSSRCCLICNSLFAISWDFTRSRFKAEQFMFSVFIWKVKCVIYNTEFSMRSVLYKASGSETTEWVLRWNVCGAKMSVPRIHFRLQISPQIYTYVMGGQNMQILWKFSFPVYNKSVVEWHW